MKRKKTKELTSAFQAFVISYFTEDGLGSSDWVAETLKRAYREDGQASCSLLEFLDKQSNKDTTQSASLEPLLKCLMGHFLLYAESLSLEVLRPLFNT